MTVLAVIAAVALMAWISLTLGHAWFWRTDQRLPDAPDPGAWPDVVAVVPARDEAHLLPRTLPPLLAQDYPGRFSVVLVDDRSSDGTGDVARRVGTGEARALTVVSGADPPPEWAGKVWAMAQGVASAEAGHPQFLLFTDADIAHAPGSVTALVRAAVAGRLDLVSQMARLHAEGFWERAVIPAFVYFFALLYPFRRVNRPGGRTAAAAGGCMLVRREALEAAGGLERIRGALIDDVSLGRLLKRRPGSGGVWLGHGAGVTSLREYGFADLWTMVARAAYTQLRHKPSLLAGTVVGLLVLFAGPPGAAIGGIVGLVAGPSTASALAAGFGLAAWALMAVTFVPMLRLYGLSTLRAVTLPAVALAYLGMTVDSARRHRRGAGGAWKGRTSA